MIDSVFKNRVFFLLAFIFIFAGILRFYRIEKVPVSLYWDEVSIAYNAYSIAQTGKDEFGNKYPLLFRGFEDYKTPASIYLTAIVIKSFGLNEFSVRFTSAFLGTLTVLVTFFLTKELLRKKVFDFNSEHIGLLATFLLAISPWHIQFSRAGFEANSGLFFVVFGSYLFFKFINSEKYKYLFFSMAIFAASLYFYRSIWVFVPLFLLALFTINYKDLFNKENIKKTILAILLFFVLLVPFFPVIILSEGADRAGQVSVVSNSQEKVYEAAKKQNLAPGIIGKIIYNRRLVYFSEFSKGYIAHFSPQFLFFNGDGNGRHGMKGIGVLYPWAILFIIPGLVALLKYDQKTKLIIIFWILIAVIPAAVSVPAPHALRSLNMIPMPQLLIALGIFWVYFYIWKKHKKTFFMFMIGIIVYFLMNYLLFYFGEYAKKSSADWADGYKQLTQYVFQNEKNYNKIIITGHYWQPYIYFLFYGKYDPVLYQGSGSKQKFDKYIFGGTSWDMNGKELGDQSLEKLAETNNFMVALSLTEYLSQKDKIDIVKEIKNHNNELVFIIGKLK